MLHHPMPRAHLCMVLPLQERDDLKALVAKHELELSTERHKLVCADTERVTLVMRLNKSPSRSVHPSVPWPPQGKHHLPR